MRRDVAQFSEIKQLCMVSFSVYFCVQQCDPKCTLIYKCHRMEFNLCYFHLYINVKFNLIY